MAMSGPPPSVTQLCLRCSGIPWEDFTRMAKIPCIWLEEDSTCPICRMLRSALRGEKYFETQFKIAVDTPQLRFRSDGDAQDSFYMRVPGIGYRGNVRLLVSSVDHDSTMSRLQHIFPPHASLNLIRGWLRECETEHDDYCSLRHHVRLRNLQVIDCEQMKIVEAPQGCRFIALSYVWGNSANSVSDNVGNKKELPTTIQQCIDLTTYLNFRFLWIDRYCIQQDDSQILDEQISQMGDIYAAADLTIIAAAGEDPWYGLPGVQPTPRNPPKHVVVGSVRVYALPQIQGHYDAFNVSKWASRAWTFQEGFFSRRRLIFTERQMLFVCNTSTRYEAVTLPFLSSRRETDLSDCTPRDQEHTYSFLDSSFMERAHKYLEGYSSRTLRHDVDALNAVKGALNTLRRGHVYHFWGVPFRYAKSSASSLHITSPKEQCGEISLSWESVSSCLPPGRGRRRREFPSWSPMGWDCPINPFMPVSTTGISVQTDKGNTQLMDLLPSSGIIPPDCSQHLRLECPTIVFTIVTKVVGSGSRSDRYTKVVLQYQDSIYVSFDTNWDVTFDKLQDQESIKGALLQVAPQKESDLMPGSASALLLQRHGQYYERVGVAYLFLLKKRKFLETTIEMKKLDMVYKGNVCKSVRDEDVEQTPWWLRYSVKETIVLA